MNKYAKSGNKIKYIIMLLLPVIVFMIFTGCGGEEQLEVTFSVSGEAEEAGVIYFLDYSINVYQDVASNPCGDCEDQPVHLYVGDDAEDTASAIADVIERADDLWEVGSVDGSTVTLREKTVGSIESIQAPSAPSGLTISAVTSGRSVPVVSGSSSSSETEEVDFPENPERLAAVYGPSYELLTMLGAEDKIVVRADVQTDSFPWAEVVFSRISEVPELVNVHTAVNFEELMSYEPDIVYTFPRENELNQLAEAGVAALAGESGETLDDLKDQVWAYADTLGEEAQERAELYCTYFDEKLAWVKSRTDQLEEDERSTVYYAGMDVLTTYGMYSDIIEVIEAAGGNPVSSDLQAGNRVQIDYEQLAEWDPDVIFFDHGGMNDRESVEELKEDVQENVIYQQITAVKNDELYLSPSGVFYWDMGIQKILLVEYMAKILHPDLFEDLDMEAEVMEFYSTFFYYDLSREDAAKILNRESPE